MVMREWVDDFIDVIGCRAVVVGWIYWMGDGPQRLGRLIFFLLNRLLLQKC